MTTENMSTKQTITDLSPELQAEINRRIKMNADLRLTELKARIAYNLYRELKETFKMQPATTRELVLLTRLNEVAEILYREGINIR